MCFKNQDQISIKLVFLMVLFSHFKVVLETILPHIFIFYIYTLDFFTYVVTYFTFFSYQELVKLCI